MTETTTRSTDVDVLVTPVVTSPSVHRHRRDRRVWAAAGHARELVVSVARRPWAAPVALAFVALYSTYLRLYALSAPCTAPCTGRSSGLIFDEKYYVNAARVILGWHVPIGSPYASAPAGSDPNSEHPPLGKLFIAAGMWVFGDRPLGWRIGSIIAGTVAIVAMYALVRAARGSRGVALGAAAVMAVDNLAFVHGRIATLDVYVLAFMLVAAAAYLRGHPLVAGVVLGVGACTKLFAVYLPIVVVLLEAGRVARAWRADRPALMGTARAAGKRLLLFVPVAVVCYLGLLAVLDAAVRPWDPNQHVYVGDVIAHTRHMFSFAADQRSPHGPVGIASYPWEWFINQTPINYYTVIRTTTVNGIVVSRHATVAFHGVINPFVIFLALPALFAAAARLLRPTGDDCDLVAVAWVAGTFGPLLGQSVLDQRTSYLYYMLLVLPGIYLALVRWFARPGMPRAARVGWAVALVVGFVALFPIRTTHWS